MSKPETEPLPFIRNIYLCSSQLTKKVWVDYIKREVLEELQGIIKIRWKIVFSFFSNNIKNPESDTLQTHPR